MFMFNPLTGRLDLVGGDGFDVNYIVTALVSNVIIPNDPFQRASAILHEVLVDNEGNLIVME